MGVERNTSVLAAATILIVLFSGALGIHFRGGTISWKSEGGTKVSFFFKMGWMYNKGPGCTSSRIGQFVTGLRKGKWECQTKNCGTGILPDLNYYCTGANEDEQWEQGKNNFTFTFPKGKGPFTIGYKGAAWIRMDSKDPKGRRKGGGDWNIATTVDLRARSDTGTSNSSPESLSKPTYNVPFNCEVRIKLPVIDPDGDKVRCRWATGTECESACDALPSASLDEETCTLEFNTSVVNGYKQNGMYAVALTIEDYPKTSMTMGGNVTMTPTDAMSSVPLQFLLKTVDQPGPCNARPRFVSPTPKESSVIVVEEGDKVKVELYTDNRNDTTYKANEMSVSGPVALAQSAVIPDVNRPDTYTSTLTWQTTSNNLGNHIVCASVTNDKGMSGQQRCFTIQVVRKGCKSSPCQNNGKCVSNKGNYTCICRPGFSGLNCEVNIDECASNTCPAGTYCVDSTTCRKIIIATGRTKIVTTTGRTTPMTTTKKNNIGSPMTTTKKNNIGSPMTTTKKNNTGSWPMVYDDCACTIKPTCEDRDWLDLSRLERGVLVFFFGFPVGLVLSVLTFYFFPKPCEKRQFGCKVHPGS